MFKILIKKSLYIALMIFIISIISFIVIHLAPNSFFASGSLNPNISKESIENLKSIYGLDRPLIEQYFAWLKSILNLEFGISFSTGAEVRDEILQRLPITLALNLISMFFVFFISLYLGVKSAKLRGGKFDVAIKQFAMLSFSMPSFYLAILLITLLSVKLNLFPISGVSSGEYSEGSLLYYLDIAWHLSLPIFVMVFTGVGSLILYIKSLTIEILKSDYIFFARVRGVSERDLDKKFILPNLYPPIITILGLSLPATIGGSVILETIFSIDGMGMLFYQSALSRDYPVIMGILIIGAFLTLLGNILADLILLKLNPHFKRES